MVGLAVFVVILCASCMSSVSPRSIKLERGKNGNVVCPVMLDNGYSADDTEAIYWSFSPKGSSDSPKRIISYYHGVTTEISYHGQYKIKNSMLVISNVTQTAEGTYNCRYVPWYKGPEDGLVDVSEFVSCKAPKVRECKEDQPSCIIETPFNTTHLNLTGSVEHAKPPMNISWFRLSSNKWEEITNATHQFEPATCNTSETDCFYFSDTYNSSSTVLVSLESINSTFKCVRSSSKLGYFNVTVSKTGSDTVTGVTNPTGFDTYEPTSLTTTVSLTSSERHDISIYFVSGLLTLNLLFTGILVKSLLQYRNRCLYLERLRRNTKHQNSVTSY